MDASRLSYLLERYMNKHTSSQEEAELITLLEPEENKEKSLAVIGDFIGRIPVTELPARSYASEMLQTILTTEKANVVTRSHRIHFLKTSWFRYAAAFILILGAAAYFWVASNSKVSTTTVTGSTSLNKDVAPGGNKAILTLADGSKIILDNTTNGTLARQGNTQIVKLDNGQLAYQLKGVAGNEQMINTVTTPRGGQYQILLPDGSKVWLNAASSITYPTTFTGKNRSVTITGEAYFEINKDAQKPFIVKTYRDEITVLGTSFNVNSYEDEPAIRTSLLQGAVQVNGRILKPGEVYTKGEVIQTNLEQDVAWKEGLFFFKNADLPTVMRQLCRWYNIDVVYEDKAPFFDFEGKLPKTLTLSQVLKIFERMEVKFRIEGRKLIVSSP